MRQCYAVLDNTLENKKIMVENSMDKPAEAIAGEKLRQKFNVFLSYSSEDLEIARALRQELMLFDVDDIDVFQDAANIRSGANWRELLQKKLKDCQWLIAVHTGEERTSHSFPGWEVGVFETEHLGDDRAKIFCLYDTKVTPGLFAEKQNRRIIVPPNKPDEEKDDFYTRTELGSLLDDFANAYRDFVPAGERTEDLAIETRKRLAAARITQAFWTCQQNDIQAQAFPQHRITIRVERGFDRSGDAMRIPDDAKLITSSNTNAAIGVESLYDESQTLKQYTWGELRQRLANRQNGDVDWMDHVNEVIVGYVGELNTGLEKVSFRTRQNQIFRAVLSRVVRYKSGAQEFELELIESFPRAFRGNDRTSLVGLIFASRFRFLFLEGSTDSYDAKLNAASGPMFPVVARQLIRDIERMEQESAEFGLTRPELLISDFGPAHEELVKFFFAQWKLAKDQLWTAITAFRNGSGTEAEVRTAFEGFRNSLISINNKFIALTLDVYKEALGM
jgi:hypothetical protein